MAILKVITYMDDIPGQKVTTSRNLYFHANAGHNSLVVTKSFDPVDITGLRLDPFSPFGKLGIDPFTNDTCAICLLFVQDVDFSGNENFLKLKKDMCQSEAADFLPRPPVKFYLADFHD